MRKQLLSGSIQFFPKKLPLKVAVFTALSLLTFQLSFAQQWNIVGNESQVSSVASNYTSLAVLNDVPYIVYTEGTVGKVKRKNSGTGVWEQVGGNLGPNVSYTRIYSDKNNKLYVTYVDANNGSKLAVVTFNTGTGAWEPLVSGNPFVSTGTVTYSISQFGSTPRSGLAFDNNNVPYITFSERATNGFAYVKRFISGAWQTLGGGAVTVTDTAVGNNIALDNNNVPYVVYVKQSNLTSTTGPLKVFRFNSGTNTWENVSPPGIVSPGSSTTGATTGTRHTSISMDSAYNPVVSYFNASNTNRATVIRYNKTTAAWSYIGTASSRDATYISLVRDNGGNVFNAFIDCVSSTCSSLARVFKLSSGGTSLTEAKSGASSGGIDASVSNINVAVGSEADKPFVVYLKTNSNGITTPVVQIFIKPSVLTTKAVTNITTTSTVTGGDISSDGGSTITERGVVYGFSPNPTLADSKIADGSGGTGSFTVALTGLTPGLYYYARSYAINAAGPAYGSNMAFTTSTASDPVVTTPKQMEYLTRGVVAVRKTSSQVYISWRLLGTEPSGIAFNLYRDSVKLNATPITTSTNYLDNTSANGTYTVKPVINGVEGAASAPASVWATNQLSVALQIPAGGTTPDGVAYTYSANDASVGDVDGDGEYEIFVKWDPSNSKDNSQSGYTGNVYIDCYKLNGTRLWRIDLGRNIRAGAHYTQFMVYDFDGNGKAEMMCKTADATIDGVGTVLGNISADYRNSNGYVLSGPEFITVFNGLTGAAMATKDFIPARGTVGDWGDTYGNRVDRFISVVAYLDGQRPSAVFGRGYYTRLVRAAWDWRNGQLTNRWVFDSNNPGNSNYAGMGNHQMSVADVDGDGKDEVINGSSVINDDGKGLWSDGKGHGDALHVTDMDLDHPGQELWMNHEEEGEYAPFGLRLKDAKTGETQWGITTTGDVGRSMVADIDPSHKGFEVWGSSGNLYDIKGNQIATSKPSYNFGIWWDGDLSRELLDGTIMDKWNYVTNSMNRLYTIYNAAPISSNNSTKANPCLTADLFGDWREEMIFRRSDNTALVIFTTNIPTEYRIPTLMHDPQYRTAVAWQNSGYNQPPYPSFYIGYDMPTPPTPNIEVKYLQAPVVNSIVTRTSTTGCDTTVSYAAEASGYPAPAYTYTFTGATTASGAGTGSGSVFNKGTTNVTIVAVNSVDTVSYSFNVTVNDSTRPTITAPANVETGTNNGSTATGVALGTPTVSDNCSNADSLIVTNDAPAEFQQGTTTVTWTVTDASGNSQTATQTITVKDDVRPTITAPTNVEVVTNEGCAATGVALGTPTVSDNSSDAEHLTITNDAPASFPVGTTNVTWTVTDSSGKSQTATQTVTVKDDVKPTITAPANVQAGTNNGCTAYGVALGTPITNDNCGIASVANDAPATYPVGTTTVTWTVTDVHGNTSTATQTVTVTDDVKPTITAPAAVTVNATSQCSASNVALGTPATADNCGVASVTNDAPATYPVGTTTVTWTVTDVHGNTSTATQTVTVTDDVKPTITAPAAVTVNATSQCSVSNVSLGTPATADNCGVASVTNDAPASYPAGTTTVTWTVTDIHGNTSTATQTITVTDNQKPTITAPAAVTVNATSQCSVSNVSLGTPATADNCGVASVTNDAPASYPAGTTTVTWTVTDVHGNTSTATQTITVKDDVKPTITAPSSQSFCYNANGYTVPLLSATDNCGIASVTYTISGATTRSGSGSNASGSFNVGVSTITWVVTDVHNNQTTASTTVTVNTSITASIADVYAISQAVDKKNTLYIGYGPSSLSVNATPAGGTAPYTYYWNTGKTTSSINVSTAGTYSVTVTDAKGCVASASIVISVVDVTCGNNNDKVTICHNGATICVASAAVQDHLNHGDKLGSCTSTTSASRMAATSASTEAQVTDAKASIATVNVKAYPNPTRGQFTVQLNNYKASRATVMILGINGLVVGQKETQLTGGSATVTFDITNKTQGMYLIRVLSTNGTSTEKIIVQR